MVQQNDATALRALVVGDVAKDFNAMQYLVGTTAPKLAGDVPMVDQVYLLDATTLQKNPDGSALDAQFFCSLNRSTMETEFVIPALPPGKYAFAIVNMEPATDSGPDAKAAPFRLSLLLRQDPPNQPQGKWLRKGRWIASRRL